MRTKAILRFCAAFATLSVLVLFVVSVQSGSSINASDHVDAPDWTSSLAYTVANTDVYRNTLHISNLGGENPPSSKWYGPDGSQVSATCGTGNVVRNFNYIGSSLFSVSDYFYIAGCDREPGVYRVTVFNLYGTDINRTFTIVKKKYYSYLPSIQRPESRPKPFSKDLPADGMVDQSINLTLGWEASAYADTYEFCYDTSNDSDCSTWIDNADSRSITLAGLTTNTTYYWQVRATNSLGTVYANGDSSAFWSFTTNDGLPGDFGKVSPEDAVTDQFLFLKLDWTEASEADSYAYCLDTTDDDLCSSWTSTLTKTEITVTDLISETTYYWQVRASNSLGDTYADSGESNFWSFTTGDTSIDAEMILIPAGEFQMGCDPDHNDDYSCWSSRLPLHTVYLDEYQIDKYEVTNAQYALCISAGACSPPSDNSTWTRESYFGNSVYANYPVVYVTWQDAYDYCSWAGKRLPTEAEWEKAGRGTSVIAYPWGDGSPTCDLANYSEGFDNQCFGDTAEVGSFPNGASIYGVMDMAGNVEEMVNDWYAADYYEISPYSNPTGPATGDKRVTRGGHWASVPEVLLVAGRGYDSRIHDAGVDNYGFRCAAPPPP